MTETWYRVHWSDCPKFNADNAWSCLWGPERSEDGSQNECTGCGGTGENYDGDPESDTFGQCSECDGTGWMDCEPGYSCVDTPTDLIEYFGRPGMAPTNDDTVIVFTGRQASTCVDGYPTVVPDQVIETLTWEQFTTRHGATA